MPDFKDDVRLRVARLNLEPAREAAIIEEMAQHLEQRFEELVSHGTAPVAAREMVLRDLNQGRWERELLQVEKPIPLEPAISSSPGIAGTMARPAKDVRYALRSLRLNPGFSTIAILSLALGIGANTAIFQLLDAVRLRTLPVKNPGELVDIRVPNAKGRRGEARGNYPIFTNAIWEQIRDHQQAFSGLAAWNTSRLNLSTGGRAR
ncbi:MAG TPA: hypothetical protein VFB79_04345, partial [Candidatus Angelobacter sp.]|nr:hypothetical protein [Candidatus Angelobacter sp.]